MRLAVVSTHPIQYYAPLFRRLTERGKLDLHVFYGWRGAAEATAHDPGFDRNVQWDISLLEGYNHTFVPNTSSDPGTHHFRGLVNPLLISTIEEWNPDAVLVFGWGWQSHLRALRHFSGRVPVFFRGDSTLLDETRRVRTLIRRLFLRWVYRHVDCALHVGTNNRAYFEAHGLGDDQLHWVPHAIDNERFSDSNGSVRKEALSWRRDLGIPPGAPTIVFAGKLSRKKGPDLLLRAFERLEVPDAHLVVAGAGPLEDDLRQRSPDQVHFIGFQNQSRMPVVYHLGRVFVLPSRGPGETWGLAVNEAMACGRPVIVSDKVGCAPDLVSEGENGFVFQTRDIKDLRDKLRKILDNRVSHKKMGARSAEIIRSWSMDRAAKRLEEAVFQFI